MYLVKAETENQYCYNVNFHSIPLFLILFKVQEKRETSRVINQGGGLYFNLAPTYPPPKIPKYEKGALLN
jgi:hypothetical protein